MEDWQRGTRTEQQQQDNNRKATVLQFIPNHTSPPRAQGRPITPHPLPPPTLFYELEQPPPPVATPLRSEAKLHRINMLRYYDSKALLYIKNLLLI